MEGTTRVCRQGRVRKTSELFFFFFLFLVPVKHQTSDSDSEHRKCLDGVKSQEAKEIEKRKIWGERKR